MKPTNMFSKESQNPNKKKIKANSKRGLNKDIFKDEDKNLSLSVVLKNEYSF